MLSSLRVFLRLFSGSYLSYFSLLSCSVCGHDSFTLKCMFLTFNILLEFFYLLLLSPTFHENDQLSYFLLL